MAASAIVEQATDIVLDVSHSLLATRLNMDVTAFPSQPDPLLLNARREPLEAPDDPVGLRAFMAEWGLLADIGEGLTIYLGEARRRLHALQDAARHVMAYRDGEGEAAERAAWSNVLEPPVSTSQARTWLQAELNHALRPFSVYVRLGPEDDASLTRPIPNLYKRSGTTARAPARGRGADSALLKRALPPPVHRAAVPSAPVREQPPRRGRPLLQPPMRQGAVRTRPASPSARRSGEVRAMGRRANGEGGIYKRANGRWSAALSYRDEHGVARRSEFRL